PAQMKGLLVLGLGLVALVAASELTLQQRVVDLVLEAFHNRKVPGALAGVGSSALLTLVSVWFQEYPAGPFVRLRLRLQQTQCRNQPGSRQDCALKRKGVSKGPATSSFCLSAAGALLQRVISSPSTGERGCSDALPAPGNEGEGQLPDEASYHPGRFAFSKGLPS
uniref:Uncharacterized protein n=1 Tax=Chelonoidis abingdonii TaxID=106734 RepID=A0A8C0GWP7_CHEAB